MKNDGKKVSRKRKKHFGFEMLDLIEFELYIMRFNDKLLREKTLWKKVICRTIEVCRCSSDKSETG